jgi:hypothetical protein
MIFENYGRGGGDIGGRAGSFNNLGGRAGSFNNLGGRAGSFNNLDRNTDSVNNSEIRVNTLGNNDGLYRNYPSLYNAYPSIINDTSPVEYSINTKILRCFCQDDDNNEICLKNGECGSCKYIFDCSNCNDNYDYMCN